MLVIRSKQLKAFQATTDAAFVRRVVEYLRERHADTVVRLPTATSTVEQLSDETLQEMVRNGISRAREYGIAWESTLAAFVALRFVTAPNFDEQPRIKALLRDNDIEPDLRIDQLWEESSDEDWEMVKRNYNPTSWNL